MDFWNEMKARKRSQGMKEQVTRDRQSIVPSEGGEMRYTPQGDPSAQGSVVAPYSESRINDRMQKQQTDIVGGAFDIAKETIDTPEKRAAVVDKYLGYYNEMVQSEEDKVMLQELREQMLNQMEQLAGGTPDVEQ